MSARAGGTSAPDTVRDATVLVAGGGFAGLAAASRLVSSGVDVLLVEAGRGLGGRVATRHTPQGLTFDHGAQYFGDKGGDFSELLKSLEAAGVVALWDARLGEVACDKGGVIDRNTFTPWPPSKRVYVGVPTNSAVGRALVATARATPGAGRLTVATSTRVASLRLDDAAAAAGGASWIAETHVAAGGPDAERSTTRHAVALAACGANSAHSIMSPSRPLLAAPARGVRSSCCFALLVAFESPLPSPLPFDGATLTGSPSLVWAARDSSKPGRGSGAETWVVHATDAWSEPRRHSPKDRVADELLAAWLHATGVDASSAPPIVYKEAHRWGSAFPANPAVSDDNCFVDVGAKCAVAGDWCVGPRAGDAWASGDAAAKNILRAML